MNRQSKIILSVVVILTVAAVITWQATGGDWYTKYEVVEQVESEPDQNDPLVAAGFYEGGTTTQTVTRDEFRFGLLPTPAGIFDKHALSVASVVGPAWGIVIGFLWIGRRKRRL
ncbi:MAG: hypothetical protein P1R58_08750 [bacterium]|nr:hypothetical protein [bacterium]